MGKIEDASALQSTIAPVLGQVMLGASCLFDSRRKAMATRLSVFAPADGATMAVDLLAALEAEWPAERGRLMLNVASEDWLLALIEAAPKTAFWIEVPAFIAGREGMHAKLQQLAAAGASLVLKGRPLQPLPAGLVNAFKLALVERDEERRTATAAAAMQALRRLPYAQTGAETLAQVREAFQVGADACVGWPLGDAPDEAAPRKDVPATVQVVVELMQRVDRQDPPNSLEAVLRSDPTLAFKLMRYINSPAFGLSVEVTSFQHAVMMLGYQRLKRWLSLLMAGAVNEPNQRPLMVLAVRRGLFMEELVRHSADEATRNELFICGVFSLLDRMLGQPFSRLLNTIPVPDGVRQALLDESGPCRPYLDLAAAVEAQLPSDIRECTERLLLSPGEVNAAVMKSLQQAQQLAMD